MAACGRDVRAVVDELDLEDTVLKQPRRVCFEERWARASYVLMCGSGERLIADCVTAWSSLVQQSR